MANPTNFCHLGGYCVFLLCPRTTVYHSDKPLTITKGVQEFELLKDPIRIWAGWVCEPAATHPDTDPFRA